jgi:hypothetical protein
LTEEACGPGAGFEQEGQRKALDCVFKDSVKSGLQRNCQQDGRPEEAIASPRNIQRSVFRQGIAMLVAGLFLGNLAALGLAAVMEHVLGGFGAPDPLTYLGVAILICAATLLACYIPARRAMKVDPMVALRYE